MPINYNSTATVSQDEVFGENHKELSDKDAH